MKEKDILDQCPKTIFDSKEFDLCINLENAGHAIRDDLARIYNRYGRINELTSKADFLFEQAKLRRDKVESIVWDKLLKDPEKSKLKMTTLKITVLTEKLEIDGEITTLINEQEKVAQLEYLVNRGKDKIKELSALLDLGRSILSWDREELSKMI